MDITYTRDAWHTYMVIAKGENFTTDYEEKMLLNQQSSILLPFHIQSLNGKVNYYYDITGKLDFGNYIEKHPADEALIKNIIRSLVNLCKAIDEFLLNPDAVLLEIAYMYVDMEMQQLYFAYVPGMQKNFTDGLQQLAACLLEYADYRDREGVLLVYDFYKVVRQEAFSPGLMENLIKFGSGKQPEKEKIPEKMIDSGLNGEEYGSSIYSTDLEANEVNESVEKNLPKEKCIGVKQWLPLLCCMVLWLVLLLFWRAGYVQMIMMRWNIQIDARLAVVGIMVLLLLPAVLIQLWLRRRIHADKGDGSDTASEAESADVRGGYYAFTDMTVPEADMGKTMILQRDRGAVRLISMNKDLHDDLLIRIFPCTLGSMPQGEGKMIAAPGISRRHARLDQCADGIYLTDLHSTNGTYVNGEKLSAGERRKLQEEDLIMLADISYMYVGNGVMAFS